MRLKIGDVLRPAAVLLVICTAVTCLLAGTNLLTKDQIAAQQAAKAESSRRIVLPGAESFEPSENGTCYVGLAGGETVGYVFETESRGYGGAVRVMTGISAQGAVTGVVILEHGETPGLGANAEREEFRAQFEQDVSPAGFSVVRYQTPGPGEIEAMTGASITSRAVTDAVNQAVAAYYQEVEADPS